MTRARMVAERWSPWSAADAYRWLALSVAGVAVVSVSWFQTHGKDTLDAQIGWATVAVAGFLLAAYANISWLLHARFMVLRQRRALLAGDDLTGAPAPASAPAKVATDHAIGYVSGAGLAMFHLGSCPLAVGRGWTPTDRATAAAGGRQPCGMCKP